MCAPGQAPGRFGEARPALGTGLQRCRSPLRVSRVPRKIPTAPVLLVIFSGTSGGAGDVSPALVGPAAWWRHQAPRRPPEAPMCILTTMGGRWGRAGGHVCANEMSPSQIRLIKSIDSRNCKVFIMIAPTPGTSVWNYEMFENGTVITVHSCGRLGAFETKEELESWSASETR